MKAVGKRNRMIRRRVLASTMVVLMLSTLITPGNGFGIRGTEANVNAASATSAITDPVDGAVNPAESQKGLPEDSPKDITPNEGISEEYTGGDISLDYADPEDAPATASLSSIYSTISASIETSDVNGNTVSLTQGDNSVKLTDGSKIFTTLSWDIADGKRVYTSTEYSYSLPDAVTFINGSSGKIFGQVDGVGSNAYIGNYKIENNVLKVTYDGDNGDDFVAQGHRSSFVNISGTLHSDKCDDEGDGKKTFSFTDVGKFGFNNIVQNKDSVVNVSKTNAGFVTENGKLYQSYNVRITSTGNNTNVVFKDIPGSKLSYVSDSLIVKKNNGAATAGSDYTEVYAGTEYTIPSMSDGDYYDFTFKYEVDSDIYTSGQGRNNSTFTDETNKQLTNEAQVKSNEDSTVELAYGTPNIQAANWVEKSGTAQDDGTVKWEVYVNRYGNYPFSLAGLKIKDILGDNISAPESVTITAGNKNEWGNITMESSGTEVPWSTFANDYALGDALIYKIEYSTKVDTSAVPVGGSLNVKNTATVTTKDGYEFTSTGSVGVDDKTTYIRKEVESADPSTGEIVYKIIVNVPAGSVDADKVIDDNLGVNAIEYDYDATQISIVADETTATYEKFVVEPSQYYRPNTKIHFGKVENKSATNQQLVIKVRTKLSSLPTTTTTFKNYATDSYSKKTAEADYEYISESFIKKSMIQNAEQYVLYKIDLLPLSDTYEGKTYTITDHIPEGMEFFADPSVNSYTVPKIYSKVNIHYLPDSEVLKDVAYTQNGKDVTFTLDADTIAALKAATGNNPVYSIIYATRLSDYLKSASEDAKDYVNTASATVDGEEGKSVSATVNMKGDVSKVLSKTGEYAATDKNDNYDYATFKVAINNEKIILNNRQPIVVTDDMSGIDEFSLNLKTYPLALKKEVKGEYGNVSWANVDLTRVYTDDLEVNQYFYDGTNRTLKIKLDDATKYELEYKMIPVAKTGTEFTGTNSVTISGSSESSVKSDKTITGKIQRTSGGGSSGIGVTLGILKRDKEDNTKKLSGAIFSITEMELNKQDDGKWIVTDNIVKDLEPTDENGTTQAENLSYYVVYKIVETKAPDGYDLDPTPHYVLIRYQNGEVPPEGYADIPHQVYAYTANGLTAFDLDAGVAPYQYVAEDKPKGVEVTASKTLDGTTANTNGFQFSLKSIATSKSGLTLKNNNVDKTAISANGLVNFDKLVYDTEDVGTYEYVMKETAVAGDYIFDDTVYTLRVEVSVDPETTILTAKGTWYRGDDSVKAVTENDKIEGNPSFNNISFATTDVSFNKNMDGQASKKAFDFTVQNVTSMNNGALVYKTDALNTFKNDYTNSVVDANSTVNVGTLKFSEAGTYAYRVAETNKTDKSIKYDNNVYLLEVLVEASADGKSLTATPKWYKTENAGLIRGAALNTAPVFDNASTGKLTVSKTVDGAPATANTKDYKFTVTKGTAPDLLYVQDAEGKLGAEEHVFTIQPGDENKFEIVNLELGTYKVTEKTDDTDVDIDGYDYLLNDSTVSGTAILSALSKEASVGLINKYEEKKPELGDFTISKNFTLTPGNVLPQNANDEKFKVDITIKNENDEVATDVTGVHGDVTFANGIATDVEITAAAAITVKDIPRGYTYEVEEKPLTEEQTVAGYVTDRVEYGDPDHKVSATTTKVTVYNGFKNPTVPTGSIKVQKKFVDSLTGEAVTPNPVTVVLHKDADGTNTSKDQTHTFAASDFTADNNFTASYTFSGLDTEAKYTVTESGNVNGILTVTKADATYKYQVAEEDNSELSPNVDASKAPTALLTNTEVYTGVDVKLAGTKTVDGASIDSSLANKFTFTLENLDLGTTVTKTNDGTGKFDYAVGPFATIGTYNYVVYESANDTNLISDTSAYRVQIEIVKSADGSKLEAKKRVKKFATKVAAETGSLSDTDLVSGDISSLDFDNTSKTLTISKQSATGGDKELPGAKLILENSKHQKYEWTSGDTETTITSSDTFELVDGTYTLVEDTAPSGYTCITTTTFEIKDGKVVEASIQGSSDVTTKGGKILVKDQFTKLNIAKAITGTPTPLAGAKLQIIDKDDNVVKIGDTELKWDSTTTAKNITGIPVGTYTLQETEAPGGYKLAPDVKFTIDKYGTITLDSSVNAETASLAADTKTITLYDEPIVIIKKTLTFDKNIYINESCSSNPAYKADATKAFAGAEFTLTQNGTSNTFTATSDETGKVSFTDLELGSYTLKETAVADGSNAKLSTDTYTAEVETDGCTIKNEAGETVTSITNDITRTDISLVKVNEADPSKKLPDSTYGLYRKLTTSTDDAEITTDDAVKIAEATTDENGVLTFKGVLLDTEYVIKEEAAPDGYYVSDKPISVEFKAGTDGKPVLKKANGSNGTAVVNSVTGAITWNEPVVIYQFTKTDEDGNPLKGAELEIRDASGRVLDKWTSDGTAHVLEGILNCGESYKLVETKAPNGYDIADPVAFTVDETMDANQNYVGKISMVDKKTKATTEITTTETTTTDTTEVTTTETTTETKTETSSTTETKTETSSTTETIEKAKSTAKTGDNSPLAMVVALMCLAVAGILVLKDKKKKLNK